MVGQHVLVVLQVLADLLLRRVFQQWFELGQYLVAVQLVRCAHVVMAHRHIGRFARLDGKGYADNFGVHITQAGGFGVEGELVGGFQAFQPLVELGLLGDDGILLLYGLGRLRLGGGCFLVAGRACVLQFGNPAAEFVFLEQFQQAVVILLPLGEVFQPEFQLHIQADGGEFTAQGQGVDSLAQVFTDLAFDFAGVFDQVIQVVIRLQPLYGGFRAAFVHARDVVHLVAHQGQVVDDLLWRYAELLHYAVTVHGGFGHGVDQRNVVAHQLGHVLVAG